MVSSLLRSVLHGAENVLKYGDGAPLRLVFTNSGVGVIIRSRDRCDLVKIKPTKSEEEYQCVLRLCRLRSSENYIVGVVSEIRIINQ